MSSSLHSDSLRQYVFDLDLNSAVKELIECERIFLLRQEEDKDVGQLIFLIEERLLSEPYKVWIEMYFKYAPMNLIFARCMKYRNLLNYLDPADTSRNSQRVREIYESFIATVDGLQPVGKN